MANSISSPLAFIFLFIKWLEKIIRNIIIIIEEESPRQKSIYGEFQDRQNNTCNTREQEKNAG